MATPLKAPKTPEKIVPHKVSRQHEPHKRSLTKSYPRGLQATRDDLTKGRRAHSDQADVLKSETSEPELSFSSPNDSYVSLSPQVLPCHPFFLHRPNHESLQQALFYPISTSGLPTTPLTWFLPSEVSESANRHSKNTVLSSPSGDSKRSGPSLGQGPTLSVSSSNSFTNPRSSRTSRGSAPQDELRTPNEDCQPVSSSVPSSSVPSSSVPSSSVCVHKESSLVPGLSVRVGPPLTTSSNAQDHYHTRSPVRIGQSALTLTENLGAHSSANANAAGMPASASSRHNQSAQILDASPLSSPPEISATGRLSHNAEKALASCFAEIDSAIQKTRVLTGLSSKQIIKRWQPSNTRSSNLWNIYQKYFHTRPEEELGRLQEKAKYIKNTKVCVKRIKASYQAFQKAEPNFRSILEVFRRIHDIDGSNTTVNGRWRHFLKYVNTMKRLAESASTIDGFEIAFCAVGSVVQQDQSLSATYCSPMVQSFFSDRLRLSDNEIEGHLKAHAYDHASRAALSNGNDESDILAPLASGQLPIKSEAFQDNKGNPEIKSEKRRLLKDLKDKVMKLVGPCKLSRLRSSHLPFSDLPKILAQSGWILENWPEDVPFPCDLQKGKGIASMRACYRDALLRAFDDHFYPVKVIKKYSEAVPPTEPVIVGVPPPPGSKYARGRRRFLDENQTVDRNGPARRIRLAMTDCHEGEGGGGPRQALRKRPESCDGNNIDQVHPKKRRKRK